MRSKPNAQPAEQLHNSATPNSQLSLDVRLERSSWEFWEFWEFWELRRWELIGSWELRSCGVDSEAPRSALRNNDGSAEGREIEDRAAVAERAGEHGPAAAAG